MVFKQEFKSKIKQEYENNTLMLSNSHKTIGEFDSENKAVNHQHILDSAVDYSSMKIPKLDFEMNENLTLDQENTIISPLLKILRQGNQKKDRKHTNEENFSKFEIKLEKIKVKEKKTKHIKANENLLSNYYSNRYVNPKLAPNETNFSPIKTRKSIEIIKKNCHIVKNGTKMRSPNSKEVSHPNRTLLPPIEYSENKKTKKFVASKPRDLSRKSELSSCLTSTKASSQNLYSVYNNQKYIKSNDKISSN